MNHRYRLILLALLVAGSSAYGAQEAGKKSPAKGYLGVSIQDVSTRVEKKMKLPNDEGALVSDVVKGSPAEKGGIRVDDVILSFGGKAVYDAQDLSRFVERTSPDTKAEVVVWREEGKKTLTVTVGKKKQRAMMSFSRSGRGDRNVVLWSGGSSLGLTVRTLGEQLAEYFGVPGKEGVLVESVKKEGPAAKAGVQAGDVITKIGEEKVAKHSDVFHELGEYDEGDKVEVELYRKGSRKTVTVEIEEVDEPDHGFFFEDFGDHDGVIVAPRFRKHSLPAPEFKVEMERFNHEELRDMSRKLRESIEEIGNGEVRIRGAIPSVPRIRRVITL